MGSGRHEENKPSNSPVAAVFVGEETDKDKRTLFDAAGGEKRLIRTCRLFYGEAGADARVQHYFQYSNIQALITKMARMVGFLLGGMRMKFYDANGKEILWDEYLVQAHARYNISDLDYDIICTHFMRALISSGYSDLVTHTVGAKLVAAEPLVVRRRVLGKRIEERETFQAALEVMTHAGSAQANAEVISRPAGG